MAENMVISPPLLQMYPSSSSSRSSSPQRAMKIPKGIGGVKDGLKPIDAPGQAVPLPYKLQTTPLPNRLDPSTSDSTLIRNKFLSSLGIPVASSDSPGSQTDRQGVPANGRGAPPVTLANYSAPPTEIVRDCSCLGNVKSFTTSLKFSGGYKEREEDFFNDNDNDEGEGDDVGVVDGSNSSLTPSTGSATSSPSPTTSSSSQLSLPPPHCKFHKSVHIVPIPMRSEYSNRVRERMWSSASELYENAARNSYEFSAEGWDWRNTLDDEHMLVCNRTGELVHPVHFQQEQGGGEEGENGQNWGEDGEGEEGIDIDGDLMAA